MLYTKFFGSKASNTNNHSDSILFSMQENQRLIKNDIRNFRSDQSFEVVNFELRYRSVKFFELIHDRSDSLFKVPGFQSEQFQSEQFFN